MTVAYGDTIREERIDEKDLAEASFRVTFDIHTIRTPNGDRYAYCVQVWYNMLRIGMPYKGDYELTTEKAREAGLRVYEDLGG